MKFSRETKNYLVHMVDEAFKTAVDEAVKAREAAAAKAVETFAEYERELDAAKARLLAEARGIAERMGLTFAPGYGLDHVEVFTTQSSHSEIARWCFLETSDGAEGSRVRAFSDVLDETYAARDRARGRAFLEIDCAKDAPSVVETVRRVCSEELAGLAALAATTAGGAK